MDGKTSPLLQPVSALPGVGDRKAQLLKKELEVSTWEDMLWQFPFRYEDRSKFHTVGNLHADLGYVQLQGSIERLTVKRGKRKPYLSAYLYDTSGAIELLWYHRVKGWAQYLAKKKDCIAHGRLFVYKNKLSLVHPEICEVGEKDKLPPFTPVYHSTAGLTKAGLDSRGLMRLQRDLLESAAPHVEEVLPAHIISTQRLMPRREALTKIHFPASRGMRKKPDTAYTSKRCFSISWHSWR